MLVKKDNSESDVFLIRLFNELEGRKIEEQLCSLLQKEIITLFSLFLYLFSLLCLHLVFIYSVCTYCLFSATMFNALGNVISEHLAINDDSIRFSVFLFSHFYSYVSPTCPSITERGTDHAYLCPSTWRHSDAHERAVYLCKASGIEKLKR